MFTAICSNARLFAPTLDKRCLSSRQAVSSLIDHTQFVTESGQILLFGISDFSRDDDRANRGFAFHYQRRVVSEMPAFDELPSICRRGLYALQVMSLDPVARYNSHLW
jgi:hypothetical protein